MVGLMDALAAAVGRATAAAAVPTTKDRRLILLDFISENDSPFHDEFHALHFGYVGQWIARDGHQVGVLACFHASNLFAQVEIEALGRRAGSHLQSLRGRHAPFYVVRKLKGLDAMAAGVSAAAEYLF